LNTFSPYNNVVFVSDKFILSLAWIWTRPWPGYGPETQTGEDYLLDWGDYCAVQCFWRNLL